MVLWLEDAEVMELYPNVAEDELQKLIRAVYKQVLGNYHIMDCERITSGESLLRNGDITVRGFVRLVAQSKLYCSKFFENSSPYRFIELNFKHLLGRAPQAQSEISEHVIIYNNQGYEAEIDSYINSDEYLSNFGENIVPFTRCNRTQVGIRSVGFNRTFALNRGFAANDIGKEAQLIIDVARNLGTKITTPNNYGSGVHSNTSKRYRINASIINRTARLNRLSRMEYNVDYSQLSQQVQNIINNGGRISSVTEVSQYKN